MVFNESPPIATYLYAIIAGPYAHVEPNVDGLPPMRIFGRQSVMKVIRHDEMFKVTQAGIRFYEQLFGNKYPYSKYDQVFVPEFNSGAMENNGCVTFSEEKLYRGATMTLNKRMRL